MDAFARIRDFMQAPRYFEAIRKYQLQPKLSEGIVTDYIPSLLVKDAVLGQHQSIPTGWLDQFQNHLAGKAEKDSPSNPSKETYAKITYDRKLEELLRNDRLRPVKFKKPKTVLEKILRVLKGKKYPQQIREPFVSEEDIIFSSKRNTEDFIYNITKPADDADQLSKPEKNFVEPERFFERLQRELIQNEQVRATKLKKRAIQKAREEYRVKHPPKVS